MKDYKRLTEKIDEPNVYTVNCDKNCLKSCDIVKCRQKVLQRLGELEKQAKAEEKQSKRWKPKNDEVYWYLDDEGIVYDRWDDLGQDNCGLLRGNVFKTEEEADWEDQHRIVATELKHFVAENDPRPITEECWGQGVAKYVLLCDYYAKELDINCVYSLLYSNQVFASSPEVLKKAIEHIGEERLKKYYFGVE